MGNKANNVPIGRKLKIRLWRLFGIHAGPTLRLYDGYGNQHNGNLFGHALLLAPIGRKTYRNIILYNFAALLRLFIVKPAKKATIIISWQNEHHEVTTEDDGFFHFNWELAKELTAGVYPVTATWKNDRDPAIVLATAEATITIPPMTDFSVVSDIDDTFLVSHSGNLRKRLYVLFTHNARSRRPFDGVVRHYQLLKQEERPFFYVSSSEWNLYSYIREFIRTQELPTGILLLNQIKTFSKIFATGQGKHRGKFTRIVKIIESFPDRQFVLLGDDSQMDPEIYAEIVEHFPSHIKCVYIRKLQEKDKTTVLDKKSSIENQGIPFCYFYHSDDAILHSETHGLIHHSTKPSTEY